MRCVPTSFMGEYLWALPFSGDRPIIKVIKCTQKTVKILCSNNISLNLKKNVPSQPIALKKEILGFKEK